MRRRHPSKTARIDIVVCNDPRPMSVSLIRRLAGTLVCAGALSAAVCGLSASPALAGGQFVPYIIGGQQSAIAAFPWQVFVVGDVDPSFEVTCGGSILNETEILTAAHCVDLDGSTTHYPASEYEVLAGASEVLGFLESEVPPSGAQVDHVVSFRTHPYYTPLPETKDDVAVLKLEKPLELAPAADTAPIGVVAAGAGPVAGTPVSISGYGKENGAEGDQPDGKLYATTLTALGSDACRGATGVNSAVLLCALGATSATCQGDSGGPLTAGSPAVEVGIVDFGQMDCPVGTIDAFTNLAAPEVRAFIEGSEAPPIAARPISGPGLKSIPLLPVDYSPLTCEPGAWSGSPSFTYTFQVEGPTQTVLQSGPANVYIPQSNVVGAAVVCVVQASNPGGVSTLRSNTVGPLANDLSAPSATISGAPKCHLQTCTLTIRASDPNAVALSVRASVSYLVATACPRGKRKKHQVCHKTKTQSLTLATLAAGSYRATASRLPYGEPVKFSARASNAAALSQLTPSSLTKTLHKPLVKKKKPKKR
jgi:Trypsin